MAVARLADPAPSPPTCPTTGSWSSSSPATCCRAPTLDQRLATGVPPQPGAQHGRRDHPGGVPRRVRGRPRAHDGDRVPRAVDAVRPLPRPQVRPDHARRSTTSSSASSRTSPTSRPATRTSSAPSRSSASRPATSKPASKLDAPAGRPGEATQVRAKRRPMPQSPLGEGPRRPRTARSSPGPGCCSQSRSTRATGTEVADVRPDVQGTVRGKREVGGRARLAGAWMRRQRPGSDLRPGRRSNGDGRSRLASGPIRRRRPAGPGFEDGRRGRPPRLGHAARRRQGLDAPRPPLAGQRLEGCHEEAAARERLAPRPGHLRRLEEGRRRAHLRRRQAEPVESTNDTLRDTLRTDKPLHIGRRGASLPFKGKLDDVQLFGLALTAENAAQLAAGNARPRQRCSRLPADKRTPAQQAQSDGSISSRIDTEYGKLEDASSLT